MSDIRTSALVWESAGTDEPRDQIADSEITPPRGASGASYSLARVDGGWTLALRAVDAAGDPVADDHLLLGLFAGESAAKDAAHRHEVAELIFAANPCGTCQGHGELSFDVEMDSGRAGEDSVRCPACA